MFQIKLSKSLNVHIGKDSLSNSPFDVTEEKVKNGGASLTHSMIRLRVAVLQVALYGPVSLLPE